MTYTVYVGSRKDKTYRYLGYAWRRFEDLDRNGRPPEGQVSIREDQTGLVVVKGW